jgi:hypothetical protein
MVTKLEVAEFEMNHMTKVNRHVSFHVVSDQP